MRFIRTFIILAALTASTAFAGKTADSVYVCNSSTSIAYHQVKTCRGLNRCTHQIIKTSRAEAIDIYRKRACKICY